MKRSRDQENGYALDGMVNCLMLLSKVGRTDTTKTQFNSRVFHCKTCNRQFTSFQALGGHRASHKKPNLSDGEVFYQDSNSSPVKAKRTAHECSICGLEFPIGQALGGHMRRHRASALVGQRVAQPLPVLKKSSSGKRVFGIDLNLTPVENDLRLQLFM